MSRDGATALQPGQQSETLSKKKKICFWSILLVFWKERRKTERMREKMKEKKGERKKETKMKEKKEESEGRRK